MQQYFSTPNSVNRQLNRWDLVFLVIIFAMLCILAWAGKQMATPYSLGDTLKISLDPKVLPFYGVRTVLRMFLAMICSLIFSWCIGTLASKNQKAEAFIIPALDILQSIPILSFLAISVTGFIRLFPNSLLGPECAAIFAIFTAQVWNMTFSVYQSLKQLPKDLLELTSILQLSAWQKFWKLEVPFAIPNLLWNMMISMSASWFFVVLSESISVSHQNIQLPGIGSYIAYAMEQKNLHAIFYAILAMIIIILIYDNILFRPLLAWSEQFKMTSSTEDVENTSWFINIIRKSRIALILYKYCQNFQDFWINYIKFPKININLDKIYHNKNHINYTNILSKLIFVLVLLFTMLVFTKFIIAIKIKELLYVLILGSITGFRVFILIILSSILWIPVGVIIGNNSKLAAKVQPVIQMIAAFPANLLYPLFVLAIVKFHLNAEIWLTPLMILGTQWYILFNVIAGTAAIPKELYLVADNFGLKGLMKWKKLILPSIFPTFITGAISAAGGAWNASIVAEWVQWGNTTLMATGIGAYIQANTLSGNLPKVVLGTAVMCLYVLLFNNLLWKPLYRFSQERFKFL